MRNGRAEICNSSAKANNFTGNKDVLTENRLERAWFCAGFSEASFSEMFPAARFQGLSALRGKEHHSRLSSARFHDTSDSGYRNAGDGAGQAGGGGSGEEQFVVLAAVESLG
jgi:hypothetical protein